MPPERDLFANFERMRREMDELFGEAFERRRLRGRGFSPRVDVYYTDNPPRAVVRVDLARVVRDAERRPFDERDDAVDTADGRTRARGPRLRHPITLGHRTRPLAG